jgi:crescentin
MSRFGFLARKPGPSEQLIEPVSPIENPLELDEELFCALGAQLGGENESLRNLLLDANNKINELDTIKSAVGKLVDPVSKALRDFETEKTEKISLQTVLNNTRTAYGKLRNEVGDLEKKLAVSERECKALRHDYGTAQTLLRAAEATKNEISIDIAARRAQITDLEARLAQQTGEAEALRDENRRLDERLVATDKRLITLDSDLNAARQRMLMAEDEKRAQQISLDKTSAESARLSRKLAETEAAFNAVQGRLRHVEANFNEVSTERSRLATALEEATERREYERTTQGMRFESVQARTVALEKVITEARELLLARAEQIREYDRHASEIANERDDARAQISALQAELLERNSKFKEADHARGTFMERSAALARAFTAKEAALAQAEETNASLNEKLSALEANLAEDKQATEQRIEDTEAALHREKLERAMVEGALETARKDFSRLMREVMAMQRNQQTETPRPRAANAA